MHRTALLVFASWTGLLVSTSPGQSLTWVANPSNCREYAVSATMTTWQAADATARSLGARLAVIRSADEQAWIDATFGGPTTRPAMAAPCTRPEILWIGLHRFDGNGNCVGMDPATTPTAQQALTARFQWVDGSPLGYTNWGPNEPNNWCDRAAVPTCLCLLYTSPSPRDRQKSRMPSSA